MMLCRPVIIDDETDLLEEQERQTEIFEPPDLPPSYTTVVAAAHSAAEDSQEHSSANISFTDTPPSLLSPPTYQEATKMQSSLIFRQSSRGSSSK